MGLELWFQGYQLWSMGYGCSDAGAGDDDSCGDLKFRVKEIGFRI